MLRRDFLGVTSAGTLAAIAGCNSTTGGTSAGDREETETEAGQDTRDITYPFLDVIDVIEMSEDTLSLELSGVAFPEEYTIQIHQNIISPNTPGRWEMKPVVGSPRRYSNAFVDWSEEESEWVIKKNSATVRPELTFEEPGEQVGSFTIPGNSDGYAYLMFIADEFDSLQRRHIPDKDDGLTRIDVNLDKSPPAHTPVVYTLTVDGDFEEDPGIVTQTPQIMWLPDGDVYARPRLHGGHRPIEPQWYGPDNRPYNGADGANGELLHKTFNPRSEYTGENETVARRTTAYSRFSDRLQEFASEGKAVDAEGNATHWDEYTFDATLSEYRFSSLIQNMWSLSYEISQETAQEARATASGTWTGNQREDVIRMTRDDRIVNHPVVQDVASRLDDICTIIGAEQPSDRLRVVLDFIQYFNYIKALYDDKSAKQYIEPPAALFRGTYGDCKGFSVATYALLTQDEFDFNPSLAFMDEVVEYNATDIGHISLGIPWSDLEVSSFDDAVDDPSDFEEMNYIENVAFSGHVYVECSTDWSIGVYSEDWPEPYLIE